LFNNDLIINIMIDLSIIRTPYAVDCPTHGTVYMTEDFYQKQLHLPNNKWICPICKEESWWNDNNYESFYNDLIIT
jgi:hypothetical protein